MICFYQDFSEEELNNKELKPIEINEQMSHNLNDLPDTHNTYLSNYNDKLHNVLQFNPSEFKPNNNRIVLNNTPLILYYLRFLTFLTLGNLPPLTIVAYLNLREMSHLRLSQTLPLESDILLRSLTQFLLLIMPA